MNGITVTGRITYIGIRRIVKTRFGEAPVATAVLEDSSGKISLNLWRGQIDLVKEGYVVRIENGFVRTYQGRIELNVGSRGRIVVLSKNKLSRL
jgi:replication factor A1